MSNKKFLHEDTGFLQLIKFVAYSQKIGHPFAERSATPSLRYSFLKN